MEKRKETDMHARERVTDEKWKFEDHLLEVAYVIYNKTIKAKEQEITKHEFEADNLI